MISDKHKIQFDYFYDNHLNAMKEKLYRGVPSSYSRIVLPPWRFGERFYILNINIFRSQLLQELFYGPKI